MATRAQLAAATEARLRTIANVTGYLGDVNPAPPTISPTDLRVRPYWVLHTGAGRPTDERLTGDLVGAEWPFIVTVAAGRAGDLNPLIDAVDGTLSGWRPYAETTRCWMDVDYSPDNALWDRDVAPPRVFLPLRFKIHT